MLSSFLFFFSLITSPLPAGEVCKKRWKLEKIFKSAHLHRFSHASFSLSAATYIASNIFRLGALKLPENKDLVFYKRFLLDNE